MTQNQNEIKPPADIRYYIDHIECSGCHELFCNVTGDEDDGDKRYCMTCFQHRHGLEKTMDVMRTLSRAPYEHNLVLWEIPVKDIPKEIADTIPYIGKRPK